MDLTVHYLGRRLAHPFMPGASPMVDDLDTVRRLEDAGAAAIVLNSLFEEQIVHEQMATYLATELHGESYAEAPGYFPNIGRLAFGPDNYLEKVRRIKEAVEVPVFASLNGSTLGGWLDFARRIEEAGADGIELNVYSLATDPAATSTAIEFDTVEMVRTVREAVAIPVAVKLAPFYTSLANVARRLVEAGADALVLFNRFYQPDIDIEDLEVSRRLHLSNDTELALRLRWLAILSAQVRTSYAVSGSIHAATDAVKAIMAGADAVQMVSALLRHGPEHLKMVRLEFCRWMEEHGYRSIDELRGSMNLGSCPDPAAYERANYMLMLQGWPE